MCISYAIQNMVHLYIFTAISLVVCLSLHNLFFFFLISHAVLGLIMELFESIITSFLKSRAYKI